jgi:hypothetical protein
MLAPTLPSTPRQITLLAALPITVNSSPLTVHPPHNVMSHSYAETLTLTCVAQEEGCL